MIKDRKRPELTGSIASEEVRKGMRMAWENSNSDSPQDRHEEGGYITRDDKGKLGFESWPAGGRDNIRVPRDKDGKFKGKKVIGTYHTHPNPPVDEYGNKWNQEPSPNDLEYIKRAKFEGESYVISRELIYVIKPDGKIEILGSREDVLGD